MFNSAASSSRLGNSAAIYATAKKDHADDCSNLVAIWSLDRSDLANAAASRSSDAEKDAKRDEQLESILERLEKLEKNK